jgi:hypothetical protein
MIQCQESGGTQPVPLPLANNALNAGSSSPHDGCDVPPLNSPLAEALSSEEPLGLRKPQGDDFEPYQWVLLL